MKRSIGSNNYDMKLGISCRILRRMLVGPSIRGGRCFSGYLNDGRQRTGTRLIDYVNSDELDINMGKQVMQKSVFNAFDEHVVPEEILEKGGKMPKDVLESIAILGLEIIRVKKGQSEDDSEVWKVAHRLYPGLHHKERKHISNDMKFFGYQSKKGHGGSFLERLLRRHGYDRRSLMNWVKCIEAPSISEAIEKMKYEEREWPAFLLRFVFRRNCTTRKECYDLLRLFQSEFKRLDKHSQMYLFIKTLRVTQQEVIEFVPRLCEMFVDMAHTDLDNSFTYNQLLWLVSRFGTGLSVREAQILCEAQKLLAQKMAAKGLLLDTKGYIALAFTLRKVAPEKSRAFVNIVKAHEYEYSQQELWALDDTKAGQHRFGVFPYRQGVEAMQILLAKDSLEALSVFDSAPERKRTPGLWSILLSRLIELGQLTSQLSDFLWKRIKTEKVRLMPNLVRKLMDGHDKNEKITRIFEEAVQMGCHVNQRLLLKCLEVTGYVDLNKSRILVQNMPWKDRYAYNVLLRSESFRHKSNVWKTYTDMRRHGIEPDQRTLTSLLTAATDPRVEWDGMFAAQRAVVEFKKWVRGAHVDSTDIHDMFKIYPDSKLFHSYIRVLGKAKYHQDLLEVLPWMNRIGLQPDKDCLCGLVVYSPNGKYLYQHGQVVGGNQWPSQQDIESYKYYEKI